MEQHLQTEQDRAVVVQTLLADCRHLAERGETSSALQTLFQAIQRLNGQSAVAPAVHHFRQELYGRMQHSSSVDELCSMIDSLSTAESARVHGGDAQAQAGCSQADGMAEAEPMAGPSGAAPQAVPFLQTRIETMSSQERAALSWAQSDSRLCQYCGGVVACSRWEQHIAQWCHGVPR